VIGFASDPSHCGDALVERHKYICIYVYVYLFICISFFICIQIYLYIHICCSFFEQVIGFASFLRTVAMLSSNVINIYVFMYMYIYLFVFLSLYIYIFIYIYTYIWCSFFTQVIGFASILRTVAMLSSNVSETLTVSAGAELEKKATAKFRYELVMSLNISLYICIYSWLNTVDIRTQPFPKKNEAPPAPSSS